MNNKGKKWGKPFVKGQVGNPDGARRHNRVKREFKLLTEKQLSEVMNLLLLTPPSEIQNEVNQDPTILKTWIARAAQVGIEKGDIGPLMSIIDRVVGRIKERVDVNVTQDDEPIDVIKARLAEKIKKFNLNE